MQVRQEWIDQYLDWAVRWDVVAEQLISEAVKRGGTASKEPFGQVHLHAPPGSLGTCLRIFLLEEESAIITGEGFRAIVSWSLTDDHNHIIVKAAESVMDGMARISASGDYLIPFEGRSVGARRHGEHIDYYELAAWSQT